MVLLSIDASVSGFAIKLSENSKIAPEKLMDLVNDDPAFSFSPGGVLRCTSFEGPLVGSIEKTLTQIKA
jgi:hypothetical protein